MRKNRITPNFFVSEPYLELAGTEVMVGDGWMWLEADDVCLFPPIKYESTPHPCPVDRIWAAWDVSLRDLNAHDPEFLDYEYIFNPSHFNEMNGGKWNTYRKNVRKWPRNHPKWLYSETCYNTDEGAELVADWLESKQEDVQDGELMARFALLELDERIQRRFLYDLTGGKLELMAINAWDENWRHINYRVCMTKRDERFLEEFVRYCFYTDPLTHMIGKMVNDGGALGNPGLERFKDKMNPFIKRKLYTWTKSNQDEKTNIN